MEDRISYILSDNARDKSVTADVSAFSEKEADKARNFHKKFDIYKPTPLAKLDNLAKKLGISKIYVKDESKRFGLNAFKVLGGSYAIGNLLAERLGKSIEDVDFEMLKSDEVKKKLGDITFYTATDGNHGRGIAWSARMLGQKSVIFMPKGSSKIRLENILKEGAKASIEDMNYDEAVRLAEKKAKETGGEMVQDTAWPGYEKIPAWIMQGYGTFFSESLEQMAADGTDRPTHIFLQAGVGAMAGAIQGMIAARFDDERRPIVTIVEPKAADCLYRSAKNHKMTNVTGDMFTIMAGLACGEPNPIGWKIIDAYSDAFLSVPENTAADGMRVLASPMAGDDKVVSGESGASTFGAVYQILSNDLYKDLRKALKIDGSSKIFCVSTEGDTDPESYERIVWRGQYPSI